MYNWLKYSGLCVILQFNPLNWTLLPTFKRERDITIDGPNTWTGKFNFLFLTIRLWFDNGDW